MPASRQEKIEELKNALHLLVDQSTPQTIKDNPIFDLSQSGEITFTLTKELVDKYQLERWLAEYEKEAKVSTGGIRGPQNILYYWDHQDFFFYKSCY